RRWASGPRRCTSAAEARKSGALPSSFCQSTSRAIQGPRRGRETENDLRPDCVTPPRPTPPSCWLRYRAVTVAAIAGRFHGNDERNDVEALAPTTQPGLDG